MVTQPPQKSHGLLLLDKPAGMTSRRCVDIVQRAYKGIKAGHSGTLDPFATGLLPICLGRATKLVEFLRTGQKTYFATAVLGLMTDTLDVTGQVIDRTSVIPKTDTEHLQQMADGFLGESDQIPPMYSAKKVNGIRLYELARQKMEVERTPKRICIYELRILRYQEPEIDFSVTCSEGTYVRTLAADLAAKTGTVGVLKALRRIRVGPYHIEEAVCLDKLRDTPAGENIWQWILPSQTITSHFPKCTIRNNCVTRYKNGCLLNRSDCVETDESNQTNSFFNVFDENGTFLGLAECPDRDAREFSFLKSVKLIDI